MSNAKKQTRWACPNGCAAVLGPLRPRSDNTCRYCLTCSSLFGATKMVRRTAATLEKKRSAQEASRAAARQAKAEERRLEAEKERAAKLEAALLAKEERATRERRQNQARAIDYVVRVLTDANGESMGVRTEVFSLLRGRGSALAHVAECRRRNRAFELVRVRYGQTHKGVFHGRVLFAWEDDEGRTVQLLSKERVAIPDVRPGHLAYVPVES